MSYLDDEGDDDEYPEVNYEAIDIPKKCALCHAHFTERNNTGKWQCTEHRGQIIDGAFTCCNTKTPYTTTEEFYRKNCDSEIRGCVRCDHKTHFLPFGGAPEGKVRVDSMYIFLIGAHREAIEVRAHRHTPDPRYYIYHVYRYDRARQDLLEKCMHLHVLALNGMRKRKYILVGSLINV